MFQDRHEAGERLADILADAAPVAPLVLALPRGGVPVALPVAKRLKVPLDLLMVRKLGVPGQPEVAAGAVVDGAAHQVVFNSDILRNMGLHEADFADAIAVRLEEIETRRARYLGGHAPEPVAGRTVIVVDDGIATGATVKAALKGLAGQKAGAIWLAVPVAPRDVLAELEPLVDRLFCLETPAYFHSVGAHYERFDQVGDDEVAGALRTLSGENKEGKDDNDA